MPAPLGHRAGRQKLARRDRRRLAISAAAAAAAAPRRPPAASWRRRRRRRRRRLGRGPPTLGKFSRSGRRAAERPLAAAAERMTCVRRASSRPATDGGRHSPPPPAALTTADGRAKEMEITPGELARIEDQRQRRDEVWLSAAQPWNDRCYADIFLLRDRNISKTANWTVYHD